MTVTNTGARAGVAVAQVYGEDPIMDHVRPWKRLLAFARVPLDAGASARVTIPIAAHAIAFYDDEMTWRVVPGAYNVSVGASSYDAALLHAPLVL